MNTINKNKIEIEDITMLLLLLLVVLPHKLPVGPTKVKIINGLE